MSPILESPTHFVKPHPPIFPGIFPRKPYCSHYPKHGTEILPLTVALKKRYIQVNDLFQKAILIDIDHGDAASRWIDSGISPPTWIATDKISGKGHLAWVLKDPVCKTQAGRDHPIRYLALVEYNITRVMGGDPLYLGLLTKNPFHTDWRVFWPGRSDYSLTDLAQGIDLLEPPRSRKETGVGRNCSLFENVRRWAYQAVAGYGAKKEWEEAVEAAARGMNTFSTPLPLGEVAGIARSVARWTWANLRPGEAKEKFVKKTHAAMEQSMRGQRSGVRRREKAEKRKNEFLDALRDPDVKIKDAAQKFGISPRTASKYIREQFHSNTNHCGNHCGTTSGNDSRLDDRLGHRVDHGFDLIIGKILRKNRLDHDRNQRKKRERVINFAFVHHLF